MQALPVEIAWHGVEIRISGNFELEGFGVEILWLGFGKCFEWQPTFIPVEKNNSVTEKGNLNNPL